MRTAPIHRLRAGVAALALGASLALAGCNRADQMTQADNASGYSLPDLPATLPLSVGEATPASYAPGASALPDVAPIRSVRVADPRQGYAYADNAYAFSDALGDAPPDYAFDYDGVDPWAWQGYDDSTVFAEPLDDGYRYYYYRAGYDEPYYVQDPDYGYGYDGGQLAVVYGLDGGIVPWADYGPRVVYASRYLVRGRDLYRASRGRRQAVIAGNWAQRSPAIFRERHVWREATLRQPGWVAYRQANGARQQAHWRDEAIRRRADAGRYAAWAARDFRTPPPPRAIPANWQRASWARDERRFAPVRAERREQLADRRQEQQADRREAQRAQAQDQRRDAQRAQAIDQRRDARDDRQAAQTRRAAVAERDDRQQARAGQQAERQQAIAQREARQAQDQTRTQQRAQGQREQRQRADIEQRAARHAAAAQRQRSQEERGVRVQRQQAQAAQAAQREQRQAQAVARQQREQARQAAPAQRAERQQAQAQRQEAQQAQRAQQAQAAERAGRQQAQQAQQAQAAERAQRQQAQQAERAQRQQQQQAQPARAEVREQRQEMRQQRQEQRGPNRDR